MSDYDAPTSENNFEFSRLNLSAVWLSEHCRFMKVGVSKRNWRLVKISIKCLTDEEVIAFLDDDELSSECVYPRMSEIEQDAYWQLAAQISSGEY